MSADYVGAPDATGDFILRDVTVVDVTDGTHAASQDVRVSGGTIAHIGATGPDAAGVTVVAGNGAFVVPGYVDGHVHALTKVFADAGVPLLAGTDANGAGWVIPGFALHDEFDLLAEAGLTPLAILRAATTAPARFFGLSAEAGQVTAGYRADLVLLASDPAESHRALRDITAVVRAGQLWSRTSLDAVLARVAANPTAG